MTEPRKGRPKVDRVKLPSVPAADFIAWQEASRLSTAAAARVLGISPNTAIKARASGAPGHVGLAMLAYSAGMTGWSLEAEREARTARAVIEALRAWVLPQPRG